MPSVAHHITPNLHTLSSSSVKVTAASVARNVSIAPQVLFLDGLTGTGKTMMGPILATFERVEVQRFEHIYEHVCALRFLGRVEQDAANVLIRMYSDLACYNLMIGRETNFRWKDLSGVLSNPGGWRYVARLFENDGSAVVDRIEKDRPVLQIASHQVLGIGQPLFDAIGPRLRVIEMVRHPLYLIEHWYSYIQRHGTDARDFTVWLRDGDRHLPWFAFGWEQKYVSCNTMDRVIHTIDWLMDRMQLTLASLDPTARQQVLVIPFERFVTAPSTYITKIGSLLASRATGASERAMRKQKVPRRLTSDGRDLSIYRRYDWIPPEKSSTEEAELKKRWDYAAKEASSEGMSVLDRMCADYERTYLQGVFSSASLQS